MTSTPFDLAECVGVPAPVAIGNVSPSFSPLESLEWPSCDIGL